MRQIGVSLSEHNIEEIKKLSEATGKSFSRVASDLIESGLSEKYQKNIKSEGEEIISDFDFKNRHYLVRILSVSAEILRCSYDDKRSKENIEKVDLIIKKITEESHQSLSSYLNINSVTPQVTL